MRSLSSEAALDVAGGAQKARHSHPLTSLTSLTSLTPLTPLQRHAFALECLFRFEKPLTDAKLKEAVAVMPVVLMPPILTLSSAHPV